MTWIGDLGMTAANALIGGGMGLATAKWQDERQIRQQQKLQDMQIAGQKQMGKYNQDLALQMWEKTNYEAQRKQLEKAGLNVGLMYDGGGAGGTTQTPGGNVTGGNAPVGGGEMGMGMQMAMQLQLLKAQKENIEADTVLKKTDAEKTAGVDTEAVKIGMQETQSKIDNLVQDLTNKKITEKQAWQELLNLQRDELLKQLDAQVKAKELTQMDLDMEKIKAETVFKQYENKWMEAGVTTHDDPRLRMLIRILNEQGIHSFKGLMSAIKDAIF